MSSPKLPIPPKMAAAIQAASRRCAGIHMATGAAEEIARAVLEYADDEYRIRQAIAGEMWTRQDVRDQVRDHMRTQLFVDLARKGLLPAAWPRELVRQFAALGGDVVNVELTVPVRRVIP